MKIMVWCGSPKGKLSITAEHVKIWEASLETGTADFAYEYPARLIGKLENDDKEFARLMDETAEADIIIWAMPVYFMLVPAGFKRFVELINERGRADVLKGKTLGILLTSIRYYDHTAMNYLQAIAEDWNCVPGAALSLGMNDVFDSGKREQLFGFGTTLQKSLEQPLQPSRQFAPLSDRGDWPYEPDLSNSPRISRRKAVLIHDGSENARLAGMMEKTRSLFEGSLEVYNLAELIRGNCLGCLKCGPDNHCSYEGKDGFIEAFRKWRNADILIMAGTIKDRFLSSVWKSYFDRSFWRTHQSSYGGKQIIWLLSGPFSHLANMREVLLTYGEMQGAAHTDFITDEEAGSNLLDEKIEKTLRRSEERAEGKVPPAVTFRKIGGFRIFRDEIFGGLKIIFRRDHRTYKREGIYDFPQKNPLKCLFINLGYALTSIPSINRKITSQMPAHMIIRYTKLREEMNR